MDASALLAFTNNEPYNCDLKSLFNDSVITTYNLTEAVNKMIISTDADEDLAWEFIGNFVENHYCLDDILSYEVIRMTKITKPLGLSLGDRYCIALGKILDLPIYTADKIWKTLETELSITVRLIR